MNTIAVARGFAIALICLQLLFIFHSRSPDSENAEVTLASTVPPPRTLLSPSEQEEEEFNARVASEMIHELLHPTRPIQSTSLELTNDVVIVLPVFGLADAADFEGMSSSHTLPIPLLQYFLTEPRVVRVIVVIDATREVDLLWARRQLKALDVSERSRVTIEPLRLLSGFTSQTFALAVFTGLWEGLRGSFAHRGDMTTFMVLHSHCTPLDPHPALFLRKLLERHATESTEFVHGCVLLDGAAHRALNAGWSVAVGGRSRRGAGKGGILLEPMLSGAAAKSVLLQFRDALRHDDRTAFVAPHCLMISAKAGEALLHVIAEVAEEREALSSQFLADVNTGRLTALAAQDWDLSLFLPFWRWQSLLRWAPLVTYSPFQFSTFVGTESRRTSVVTKIRTTAAAVRCVIHTNVSELVVPDVALLDALDEGLFLTERTARDRLWVPTPPDGTNLAVGSSAISMPWGSLDTREMLIIWTFWCCKCCGFSNEILHLLLPLRTRFHIRTPADTRCFCSGFPTHTESALVLSEITEMEYVANPAPHKIWIAHGDCHFIRGSLFPHADWPSYVIGRVMYEFSRIPHDWVAPCNAPRVNELWLPTAEVAQFFIDSGIREEKIVLLPEAIDVSFYNPELQDSLDLPPVPPSDEPGRFSTPSPFGRVFSSKRYDHSQRDYYKFFTSFKWEERKGWQELFEAYFSTFSSRDPVTLYVHTHLWLLTDEERAKTDARDPKVINERIQDYLNETFFEEDSERTATFLNDPATWPHYVIICDNLSEELLASLYRSVNAFVLPTRGEGWGLPTIQAMAMALPTISTAWAGNMAFMTKSNSILIPVARLEELPQDTMYGWEPNKTWARPDVEMLKVAMQKLFNHPHLGVALGRVARKDIEEFFSEEAVARLYEERFNAIKAFLRGGGAARGESVLQHRMTPRGPGGMRQLLPLVPKRRLESIVLPRASWESSASLSPRGGSAGGPSPFASKQSAFAWMLLRIGVILAVGLAALFLLGGWILRKQWRMNKAR